MGRLTVRLTGPMLYAALAASTLRACSCASALGFESSFTNRCSCSRTLRPSTSKTSR